MDSNPNNYNFLFTIKIIIIKIFFTVVDHKLKPYYFYFLLPIKIIIIKIYFVKRVVGLSLSNLNFLLVAALS